MWDTPVTIGHAVGMSSWPSSSEEPDSSWVDDVTPEEWPIVLAATILAVLNGDHLPTDLQMMVAPFALNEWMRDLGLPPVRLTRWVGGFHAA